MKRQIIQIDKDLCNGCGLCVNACHEGAIALVDGKAQLIRDDYCDGLGNCLPVCPTGAISFVEREAAPFDAEAVKANMEKKNAESGGCPGSQAQVIEHKGAPAGCPGKAARAIERPEPAAPAAAPAQAPVSRLRQWPVQIKLVPPNAPYFNGAHLLVAADCAAYAYAAFHEEFMKNKITLIGCPKLDQADYDYSEKLAAILKENDIRSVTVARMEVPCCGGLVYAVEKALQNSGKMIPWRIVTISTDGEILSEEP